MLRLDEGGRRRVALDLSHRVKKLGAEQGLLGIAFHPDFATDRRLYLHWSHPKGDTRVAEFRARRDGTIEPEPLRGLLFVDQPEENHNGGQLLFGPDGRLYLGLGDGGGAFDPRRTAQDPGNRLGKILAADVRERRPRWDVVLTGLRNPWRFSFDRRSASSGSATSARTRSRRSTACCSSSTSRRRTSAGAPSRAPSAWGATTSTPRASSSGRSPSTRTRRAAR